MPKCIIENCSHNNDILFFELEGNLVFCKFHYNEICKTIKDFISLKDRIISFSELSDFLKVYVKIRKHFNDHNRLMNQLSETKDTIEIKQKYNKILKLWKIYDNTDMSNMDDFDSLKVYVNLIGGLREIIKGNYYIII